MALFQVELQHVDGGVTVRLDGELDVASADVVRRELRPLTYRYDRDQLTFDCTDLHFADVTGLCALVDATRPMAGGRPVLANPSSLVRRLLDLTDLHGSFEVAEAPPGDRHDTSPASARPACNRPRGAASLPPLPPSERPFFPAATSRFP